MSINERLKELREELELTQTEFGEPLGVTPTAISILESGKRKLTKQMILAICREFNVNEDWLRTGEGGEKAMFNKDCDSQLESLMEEKNLDDMSRKILKAFWELPQKKRERASDFIYALSRSVLAEDIDSINKDIINIIDNVHLSANSKIIPGKVKSELKLNVGLAFMKRLPYVGEGSADIEEAENEAIHRILPSVTEESATKADSPLSLEEEADKFAEIAREQFLTEKKRALKISSVKESGAELLPGMVK